MSVFFFYGCKASEKKNSFSHSDVIFFFPHNQLIASAGCVSAVTVLGNL